MKIKKELIKREIAGDVILVPVGKTVLDSNGLFMLNEQAAFLWDCLQEAENAQQLTEKLLETYDVDEDTAAADTAEFLQTLRQMKIL